MDQNTLQILTVLIFLLPVMGWLFSALVPRSIFKRIDVFATSIMGFALLLALCVFTQSWGSAGNLLLDINFAWLPTSSGKSLNCGLMLDRLTAVMLVVVTGISFLVHLFSTRYMEGDVRYERYYSCLLLFTVSMLGLVLANNLLFLFFFWELVGLSSYLLIGHWFEKKSASNAAIKAFITTRVGDVGMFIGIMILYLQVGSIQYVDIFAAVQNGELAGQWRTLAGLGIFFGAMGKSAQFPLHVWLPDAMEGPTPVSALIHAATMVAAGVYLTGRMYPIFDAQTLLFIAYIGAITAFFAASIALVQDDIKKVLAYSTVSQLGYMVMGLGVGGYSSGLFHLTTHAFFKAGLFLGAGAVIYAMHHEQSMSKYGGLMKRMPKTAWCYLLFTLALTGFPGFSGFWSKDAILADSLVFSGQHGHWFIPLAGFATVFMTAFYMFRQYFLTFLGRPRDQHAYDHAKEPPWQMVLPLMLLALLSIGSGGIDGKWFADLNPNRTGLQQIEEFAGLGYASTQVSEALSAGEGHSASEHGVDHEVAHHAHVQAMQFSTLLGLLGICLAVLMYWQKKNGRTLISPEALVSRVRPLHTLLWNKYYLDEIYDAVLIKPVLVIAAGLSRFDRLVIDGLVNLAGRAGCFTSWLVELADRIVLDSWLVNGLADATGVLGRRLSLMQTGRVRQYLGALVSGLALISLLFIWVIQR